MKCGTGPLKQLLFLLLIVLQPLPCSAAMYVCRDASGLSYTNLPLLASCVPLQFKKQTVIPSAKETYLWTDPASYSSHIRRASRRYRVDENFIRAMIRVESNFDRRAVSSKGAQGLMQLMPGTAKDLGVKNPFDPGENIAGGTRYFRRQLDRFDGDVILSLAAYNAGPNLVRRLGAVPQNRETPAYVKKVMRYYRLYKAQDKK
ncbi:lytic transglycosylase domain-containing protein [Desulfotalea psychrophila]|uniref:Related to soluble lytic murein transglycosylase [precursor] n=1 Tax=Desulfotalea psychrophila (strain LSv54 / DSM 12343) TaxID=177439 RepID=Q6AR68_DESPS|nr:lytic transglycosylase domain-containing protein [Desulfotalea psychrophila]CAG35156.1 related to soluble lytic murein transglycosylase [precursor] [Desulfotalea psychrophila LSv54]